MEENPQSKQQREFVFSKAVKAGKRIYYFDVRKTRNNDDLFVSIVESKRNVSGTEQNPQVAFQKQKITIYKEDLKNFADAMKEIVDFVEQAKDIEHLETQEFKPQNADGKNQPNEANTKEKPKKLGSRFKAMFDDIFAGA